jgi:hypothetical protein
VLQGLHRRGLRGRAAEERLADLVHRGDERGVAGQRVAHPQAGQAVDLRERAQEDEVGVARQQVDRRVGVVEHGELAVGLVQHDADVPRHRLHERPQRLEADRVDVGLFGLQTMTIRVATVISASIASRSCSWRSLSGTRIARAPDAASRCG